MKKPDRGVLQAGRTSSARSNGSPTGEGAHDHADGASLGAFTTPGGAAAPGVILPGDSYSFTVTAAPGDRLSLATMFVQSNDLFYAPQPAGIELFQAGMSISGDVSSQLMLWDAGTEVNELPGVGLNQAPRQSGADTGPDENGNVRLVSDGFTYAPVSDVIRVTVTPRM